MEHFQISELNGLDQHYITVKDSLFIGNIDHVIHKSS